MCRFYSSIWFENVEISQFAFVKITLFAARIYTSVFIIFCQKDYLRRGKMNIRKIFPFLWYTFDEAYLASSKVPLIFEIGKRKKHGLFRICELILISAAETLSRILINLYISVVIFILSSRVYAFALFLSLFKHLLFLSSSLTSAKKFDTSLIKSFQLKEVAGKASLPNPGISINTS